AGHAPPVEPFLVELADQVRSRVAAPREREVAKGVLEEGSPAEVPPADVVDVLGHVADEVDVVVVLDRGGGLRLEQILDVEVVERAQNGASGHGRDGLDMAEPAPHGRARAET